jgi:transposase
MSFTLHLSPFTRKQLYRHLQQADARGALRVVKRLHVLLAWAEEMSVQEVAALAGLGEQTVRAYRNGFRLRRMASLTYKRPPGRPRTWTQAPRRELAALSEAGPQAAGSTSGGWHTPMIHDLIQHRFGVSYPPHSLATLLHHWGFSSQQARVVSDHLTETKRLEWCQTTWPRMLRPARQRTARLLFGEEARFAPWGSLRSPWAPRGHQPAVLTSGKRKAYKVFGFIDYFSGRLFFQGHPGRFHSESYAAFWLAGLAQTTQQVFGMQAGARYHTRRAMPPFFNPQADRLTIKQLPSYSPDFNPIAHLWQKVKKEATHLKYFPECTRLQVEVDRALVHFAQPPSEITVRMARYDETLGAIAA